VKVRGGRSRRGCVWRVGGTTSLARHHHYAAVPADFCMGGGGEGEGGGQSRVGYVTEEGGRVEVKWQRREAEERLSDRGMRQSRGYVAEEGGRVEDTWQRREGE
jgi:hypothetical protein